MRDGTTLALRPMERGYMSEKWWDSIKTLLYSTARISICSLSIPCHTKQALFRTGGFFVVIHAALGVLPLRAQKKSEAFATWRGRSLEDLGPFASPGRHKGSRIKACLTHTQQQPCGSKRCWSCCIKAAPQRHTAPMKPQTRQTLGEFYAVPGKRRLRETIRHRPVLYLRLHLLRSRTYNVRHCHAFNLRASLRAFSGAE